MPTPRKKLALLGTFFLLIGCKAVTPTTALPALLPTPIPAPVTQTTSTMEVITGYGFPYVSASLYGDAGNFEIQAGVLAQVTWTDAPPAADYYEFTLRLHTDKFILLIGTATDDTDGISVDWLIPEHTVETYGPAPTFQMIGKCIPLPSTFIPIKLCLKAPASCVRIPLSRCPSIRVPLTQAKSSA